MKLRTGKDVYRLPHHHSVVHVVINGRHVHNKGSARGLEPLTQVPRDETRGPPCSYAVRDGFIRFYPIPDRPYQVTVRYLPPAADY